MGARIGGLLAWCLLFSFVMNLMPGDVEFATASEAAMGAVGGGGVLFAITGVPALIVYAVKRSRLATLWTWTAFILVANVVLAIGKVHQTTHPLPPL